MSIQERFPKAIPTETERIVSGILPGGSVCRLLGERGEQLVNEEALLALYHREGRGGINPVILSFVSILQFLEDIPDRQAAEMAVLRMDWKYALRQELSWEGFHYADLCNFRKRLREGGQAYLIFEQLLEYLRKAGYLKSKRQRTDATHVLAHIEHLSRLELVWETIRVALSGLVSADAPWVLQWIPASFSSSHSQRRSDYRLSKAQQEQEMQNAGQEGYWLLAQVTQHGSSSLKALPEVALLERVLAEQFDPPGSGPVTMKARIAGSACGDVIVSPHDPEARYSRKNASTEWEGYKAQVTESIDGPVPFITDIAPHSAIEADNQALTTIQQRLESRHQRSEQQYVDRAYCNGATIQLSQQQQIDLRGYVSESGNKPPGFRLEDFQIDLDRRIARCPQGHLATVFAPSQQADVAFHVRFGRQCQDCPVRLQCTQERRGRSLEISPYHAQLSQRRQLQRDPDYQQDLHARARIESTLSELTRRHGLRRCRYRGKCRITLQMVLAAVALNLKRLARYLNPNPVSLWISTMDTSPTFCSM